MHRDASVGLIVEALKMREFSDVEDADGAGGEDCITVLDATTLRRRRRSMFQLKNVKGYRIYVARGVASKFNLKIEHGARERKHTAGRQSERCAGHIIHTPTPGRTNNILLRYKEVG